MRKQLGSIVSQVKSLFVMAKCCKWSLDTLLQELNTVHESLNAKTQSGRAKYTKAEIGFVKGMIAAKLENITENLTAHYYIIDGVLCAANRRDATGDIKHYSEVAGQDWFADADRGGIFWKNTDKRWS